MPITAPPPNSFHPQTRAEWRAWLEQHHTQASARALVFVFLAPASVRSGAANHPRLACRACQDHRLAHACPFATRRYHF
ncbi:MAG: hypothetical protein GYB65_16645 [Chloroflexi bacterium]|nr:hypothetical protein [Chloroflexota bacterium]